MFLFTDTSPYGRVPALLDWKFVHENMAWSVILLLGGGFALADAVKVKQYSVILLSLCPKDYISSALRERFTDILP